MRIDKMEASAYSCVCCVLLFATVKAFAGAESAPVQYVSTGHGDWARAKATAACACRKLPWWSNLRDMMDMWYMPRDK